MKNLPFSDRLSKVPRGQYTLKELHQTYFSDIKEHSLYISLVRVKVKKSKELFRGYEIQFFILE